MTNFVHMGDFRVHVYMLNEHFSQEHADANHEGKESENNKLLDWEDEMVLRGDVEFLEEETKGVYTIKGYKNDNLFEIPLSNMRIFKFKNAENVETQIACSESIYNNHSLDKVEQKIELTLNGEPYANPIPGIYIATQEFPKELIVGD